MEMKYVKIHSRINSKLILRTIPGHFATSHSHINCYIDMTGLRTRQSEAAEAARELVKRYQNTTIVDTIVCMDGCEVIGAYLAEELVRGDFMSMNAHQTVYIVSPEINSNNQLLFRDNLVPSVNGKNILLLFASATTGRTMDRSLECIQYYGGIVQGICAVFSAVSEVNGIKVESLFTVDDIPGYQTYSPHECPFCRAGQKLDGFANSSGYTKL
ncbi:orotate phosphoribosyltransferase [Anaerolentibacter hominis]|uniref:phosphoribosyltransferase n=1 Tax=Anaerolentibacter hominis TaxID=3079009 RepID=UPI0031B8AD86